MRPIKVITLTSFLFFFIACGFETPKNGTGNSGRNIAVENVKIKKEFPNAWAVTGMVRNNGSSSIKGAVKIKFLNSNGDIVHSTRTKVNDGDNLNSGQAGNFEYFAKPEKFDGVTDFDVEFYER